MVWLEEMVSMSVMRAAIGVLSSGQATPRTYIRTPGECSAGRAGRKLFQVGVAISVWVGTQISQILSAVLFYDEM